MGVHLEFIYPKPGLLDEQVCGKARAWVNSGFLKWSWNILRKFCFSFPTCPQSKDARLNMYIVETFLRQYSPVDFIFINQNFRNLAHLMNSFPDVYFSYQAPLQRTNSCFYPACIDAFTNSYWPTWAIKVPGIRNSDVRVAHAWEGLIDTFTIVGKRGDCSSTLPLAQLLVPLSNLSRN